MLYIYRPVVRTLEIGIDSELALIIGQNKKFPQTIAMYLSLYDHLTLEYSMHLVHHLTSLMQIWGVMEGCVHLHRIQLLFLV